MSLPIPLAVWLRSARGSRCVTTEARDLRFGWADPGGFSSCTVPLARPLILQPDEIAYYSQLTVYDRRDGTVVFDGRLEDPARSAGSDGQIWQLTAIGGKAHLADRTVPLIYVDKSLTGWTKAKVVGTENQNAQVSSGEDPSGGQDALVLSFPTGTAVAVGGSDSAYYLGLQNAGQELALFDYTWDAGLTSATWELRGFTSFSTVVRTNTANTAGGGSNAAGVGGAFTLGDDLPLVQLRANAATTTSTSDITWASFRNVAVVAVRYNANGTKKTGGYSTDPRVRASEVVADLLGRLLTQYDGAGATIATTSHLIDQLAYPDGTTAEKVLQDMLALEGGFTWRVWERNSAGKYRFEWVQRPNTVRYEADVIDGYDSQGSGGGNDGLFERVTVRWRDAKGQIKSTTRTQTVPDLVAAGITRQAPLDLGDNMGSLAAAQRAGDQFLAQHQFAPNAGTLRIARPILDLQTARMVMPWEIRPGLIRVRGILPRTDALNPTDRDGVTVFRIVSSTYSASDGAATLELDSYARTTPRLIAGLIQSMPSSRRR